MHAQAALHQTGALPAMGAVRILLPHLGHFHYASHVYHTPPAQYKHCQISRCMLHGLHRQDRHWLFSELA